MSTPNAVLLVVWALGLVDQALEHRAIHLSKDTSMTVAHWALRRRAARASLVVHAIVMTLLLPYANRFAIAAWFVFSALMWALADIATPGARPQPTTANPAPERATR